MFQRSALLPDGTLIRRSYRAWFDAAAGLEHTDDQYELVRDGMVVERDRKVRSPAVRHYDRPDIIALHQRAGFQDVRFLSEFTWDVARPGDRIVTTLATRASDA